jgi:hypothetical protein
LTQLEVAIKGKSASTFEMRDYTSRLSEVKVPSLPYLHQLQNVLTHLAKTAHPLTTSTT